MIKYVFWRAVSNDKPWLRVSGYEIPKFRYVFPVCPTAALLCVNAGYER